jgi:hypothetical protein
MIKKRQDLFIDIKVTPKLARKHFIVVSLVPGEPQRPRSLNQDHTNLASGSRVITNKTQRISVVICVIRKQTRQWEYVFNDFITRMKYKPLGLDDLRSTACASPFRRIPRTVAQFASDWRGSPLQVRIIDFTMLNWRAKQGFTTIDNTSWREISRSRWIREPVPPTLRSTEGLAHPTPSTAIAPRHITYRNEWVR